jgi:hypothetical protein
MYNDAHSNSSDCRFFVAILDNFGNFSQDVRQSYLLVAISTSNNPGGLTSSDWNFYNFNVKDPTTYNYALFPKGGYNASGFVVTYDMLDGYYNGSNNSNYGQFVHVSSIAIKNDGTNQGGTKVVPVQPTSPDGNYTLVPAQMHSALSNDDSGQQPMYFVEAPIVPQDSNGHYSIVHVLKETYVFTSSGATWSFLADPISVNPYLSTSNPSDPGGSPGLDLFPTGQTDYAWQMESMALRTVGGDTYLVAAHAVRQDSSAGSSDCIDWAEFQLTTGSSPIALVQQGEINPGAGVYDFLPGVEIAANGAIGLEYLECSASEYLSMYVTQHLPSDPAGVMDPPVLLQSGAAALEGKPGGSGGVIVGDSTSISIDPSDGSFWGVNEYASSTSGIYGGTGVDNWATYVAHWVPDEFVFTAPSSATAGTSFTVTVTAKHLNSSSADTSYGGTVHFTSSDSQAVLPANATLTNGVGTFTVTLKTVGSGTQTLTATDTANPTIIGDSNPISLGAAAPSHFSVTAPAQVAASSAFNFTVTALDSYGNLASSYSGTVHFSSTDSQAALPGNHTLSGGSGVFTATLNTGSSGGTNQTVTATDTVTSSITGSAVISVHSIVVGLTVIAPVSVTSGSTFNVTVFAFDQYGNLATGYGGTLQFTSTDSSATLPGNHTLTNAVGVFTAVLYGTSQSGTSYTITATDTINSGITGTTSSITVFKAPDVFSVTLSTTQPSAGALVYVYAVAYYGTPPNLVVDTNFNDTVHFSTTDNLAALPTDSALSGGYLTPALAVFKTAGTQKVTATDVGNSSVTGDAILTVTGLAASHFEILAPSVVIVGTSFSITVLAEDTYGNLDATYAGTVQFASSDGAASLPASTTLSSGVGVFSATLNTTGSQTIGATDTANSAISGSASLAVAAQNAFTITLSSTTVGLTDGPSPYVEVTITAVDGNGNTISTFNGSVIITVGGLPGGSSSGFAYLGTGYAFGSPPPSISLVNGVAVIDAWFDSDGVWSITVWDSTNSSISGSSAGITATFGG